jgi:protein ImuB
MFAVIHLPDFQLQAALRLEPELWSQPVALLEEPPAKAVVWQMTEPARQAGVVRGQTATQAAARRSGLLIKSRARAQEQTVAGLLLQCAACFSPAVEATAEGVCTLDLKGLPLEGEPERWAQTIIDSLARLQLQARLGVGDTPQIAALAARRARPFLRARDAGEFIAALPLADLEPSPDILEILQLWGIRTVGGFLALGRENLAERLGPEAVELFERAASRQARPLHLAVPDETFAEAMDFEPPVETLEPLLFVLRRFVGQLARRLEMVYQVAAELKLHLDLSSGAAWERLFLVPAPTSDVETLFRMLQTHLENVRTDAPIVALRLCAKPGRAARHQFGLFEAALRDPNQFHETLARLTALLGPRRVGTPLLEETYRPDSFRMELEGLVAPRPDEPASGADDPPPAGPPLRRFRPPAPAVVEMRSERPALLRSGPFTGPISRASGPWRASGQWWDAQGWAREEWDVQTWRGDLFRLARQDEQWFVDGIFD